MQESNNISWTHEERRLWRIVQENPKDAGSWSALMEAVETHKVLTEDTETQNAMQKIIAVYHHFLASFPLCVKHRKKFADWLVEFKLKDSALKLYEGSIWPISGSLEFWLNYYDLSCTWKDYDYLHGLLQFAIARVGSQYGSIKLWQLSIEFEENNLRWDEVSKLYAKLFVNPVRGIEALFERFKQFSKARPASELIIFREEMGHCSDTVSPISEDQVDLYIKNKKQQAKEFEKNIIEFESHIQRFDFEPGQVEDAAADVWHRYITFMENEYPEKVMQTLERCLVPCATRTDLWLRYSEFMEDRHGYDTAAHALRLAFNYIGDGKLDLLLFSAELMERNKDISGARHVYDSIKNDYNPIPLKALEAHANFEHRMGNGEGAARLFEDAIGTEVGSGSGLFSPALRLKYACFALLVLENPSKAKEILTSLLNLELSTPVVAGVIDIACALPEKERTEFLDSLDRVLVKFILAEAEDEIQSEISDKIDISLMYLQFLDNFGDRDTVKTATRRHLVRFRRGTTLLPKRRLDYMRDFEISKIDGGSATDKKLGKIVMSLPQFVSTYAKALVKDRVLNVGVLKGRTCSRITKMGQCLLRAIYKALLEQHASMLTWDGDFSAEDIILTCDSTVSSIVCSIRKEASRFNDYWALRTKSDYIKLKGILSPSFKSTTTEMHPPYVDSLFSFVESASAACDKNVNLRKLFLDQVAQHPVFKSPSVRMSLCRELYIYMNEHNKWKDIDSHPAGGHNSKQFCSDINEADALVEKICAAQSVKRTEGTSWIVSIIRHIENHAVEHLQDLSMSIEGVEDLYDLVDHHYEKFLAAFVMNLLKSVNGPGSDIRLISILNKYSKSH